jgi:hypothetical protein
MAETLKEYLEKNSSGGFHSFPQYFPSGDYLTYFTSSERCHAKRLNDVITVFLANESKRLVGCKVKGVAHILKTAGDFHVQVWDGDDSIRLGFFFFYATGLDRADTEHQWSELLKSMSNVTIPRSILLEA